MPWLSRRLRALEHLRLRRNRLTSAAGLTALAGRPVATSRAASRQWAFVGNRRIHGHSGLADRKFVPYPFTGRTAGGLKKEGIGQKVLPSPPEQSRPGDGDPA